MLKCYLDDSGTHNDSRVIVWGGVAGDVNYFKSFQKVWQETLNNPCDGHKPPIKAFHSYDLMCGINEFEGYSLAERDRARFNFRKIILDCSLTWLSYGILKNDWDKVIQDYKWADELDFSPEAMIFGRLIMDVTKGAIDHGEPVSFQFDKGRASPQLCSVIEPVFKKLGVDDSFVSYDFCPVKAVLGLQAADLVAHQSYQFFSGYSENQDAKPNAHLQKLIDGAFSYKEGLFDQDNIRSAFEEVAKRHGLPYLT